MVSKTEYQIIMTLMNSLILFMKHRITDNTLLTFSGTQLWYLIVSHEVLVSRLKYYGVMGIILNRFRSYLNDRRQTVYLEYSATHYFQSDWESIKCGVRQGSVLDPMLFNIHIHDLPKLWINSHTPYYMLMTLIS